MGLGTGIGWIPFGFAVIGAISGVISGGSKAAETPEEKLYNATQGMVDEMLYWETLGVIGIAAPGLVSNPTGGMITEAAMETTVDILYAIKDNVTLAPGSMAWIFLTNIITTGGTSFKQLDEAWSYLKGAKNLDDFKLRAQKLIKGGTPTFKYKEVKTFTAEETNQWFIDNVKPDYKPPYKPGTIVKEIELTENTTFVRVYDNMPDGSGMYGSWVMKAEDIEGLTPLEIQNKFALPNTPKYVCDVELEAGTHIRVGEVNPLDGWGSGGGTQYDLIGQRIGDFKNERLLEGN